MLIFNFILWDTFEFYTGKKEIISRTCWELGTGARDIKNTALKKNLLNYLEKLGVLTGPNGPFPTPKLNRPFSLLQLDSQDNSFSLFLSLSLTHSLPLTLFYSHSSSYLHIYTHWNDRWRGTSSSRTKGVESGMPMPSHKFIRQKSHFFHGEECVMGDWKSSQIFLYIHRNGKNCYKCFL